MSCIFIGTSPGWVGSLIADLGPEAFQPFPAWKRFWLDASLPTSPELITIGAGGEKGHAPVCLSVFGCKYSSLLTYPECTHKVFCIRDRFLINSLNVNNKYINPLAHPRGLTLGQGSIALASSQMVHRGGIRKIVCLLTKRKEGAVPLPSWRTLHGNLMGLKPASHPLVGK